jgi:hypothetical protein
LTFGAEKTAQYRGFNIYGGCEPFGETLLGHINQWKPTGCIAFKIHSAVRDIKSLVTV